MGVSLDEFRRLSRRSCPDCQGTGFWYPQGPEKGVAKCKHTKVLTSAVFKHRLAELRLINQQYDLMRKSVNKASMPPQFGERILLLLLNKDERINIPGDLAEEFVEIATKHGARFARVWYYKQVVGSAWPIARKAFPWGLLVLVGEWIRQRV